MSSLVVFRADGGPAIGGGHVMRCMALASAFAEGGARVGFAATAETFKSVAALTGSSYEKLIVSGTPAEEAKQIGDKWASEKPLVIADHYGRDAGFEQPCRSFAGKIAVIDDLADRKHDADALFDSGAASANSYDGLVPPGCKVFAGPSYAIVHPDFRLARDAALPRRDGRAVARILVAFGQVDANNATALSLDAIEASGFNGAVDVVLGQSAPHLASIRRRSKGKITLYVNATNMPALIATSDLGIGAGGVTAWERCCLGLPSIMLTIADNQRNIIALASAAGAGIDAGQASTDSQSLLVTALRDLLSSSELRVKMAKAATGLVDGAGARRIVDALRVV
jgi:UDP-2,4-diacetamido-2,4,6-trideoxy-beta-L-altropyranose hydrolase